MHAFVDQIERSGSVTAVGVFACMYNHAELWGLGVLCCLISQLTGQGSKWQNDMFVDQGTVVHLAACLQLRSLALSLSGRSGLTCCELLTFCCAHGCFRVATKDTCECSCLAATMGHIQMYLE